jgi:hypothetical protein
MTGSAQLSIDPIVNNVAEIRSGARSRGTILINKKNIIGRKTKP